MRSCLLLLLVVLSNPAFALRCGSKLIDEGLTVKAVIDACGEPAESKDLGLRTVPYVGHRSKGASVIGRDPLGGRFSQEVRVRELIYDFGPRKLKRRLTFYDGILVDVTTLGYGERR